MESFKQKLIRQKKQEKIAIEYIKDFEISELIEFYVLLKSEYQIDDLPSQNEMLFFETKVLSEKIDEFIKEFQQP